jgi:SAM-dependent methyltransferase
MNIPTVSLPKSITALATREARSFSADISGDRALIEQNIANWNALFSCRPRWSRYPPEELAGFIAKNFPDREQRRTLKALEVGCGPGANLWFLAREGFRIAGIDGSAVAINSTRERLLAEGMNEALLHADLKVGNFALLPWSDSSFDAVIDIQAISHNTTPVIQSVIAEIRRVLKPGGWFFARMFGEETTGIVTGNLVEERTTKCAEFGPLAGCGLVHSFSAQEIATLLSPFQKVTLDWVHRRVGKAFDVFEWIVQAKK